MLAKHDITVFVLRDPRDVLASRYHYIMGLKRHRLHPFLADPARTELERYRLLIDGHHGDPYLRPMNEMLLQFAPWTDSERTLTVTFEALVGARGGGDDAVKNAALLQIARHCGIDEKNIPQEAAGLRRRRPFRKGKSGTWREELPTEIQALVEDRCARPCAGSATLNAASVPDLRRSPRPVVPQVATGQELQSLDGTIRRHAEVERSAVQPPDRPRASVPGTLLPSTCSPHSICHDSPCPHRGNDIRTSRNPAPDEGSGTRRHRERGFANGFSRRGCLRPGLTVITVRCALPFFQSKGPLPSVSDCSSNAAN